MFFVVKCDPLLACAAEFDEDQQAHLHPVTLMGKATEEFLPTEGLGES